MKKASLILLFFMCSSIALADYDQTFIKQEVTKKANSLGIDSWRKSENGEAWIANTGTEGILLSVGKSNSRIIALIKNTEQSLDAMLRCKILGVIAMQPDSNDQKDQIGTVILNAAQSLSEKSLKINGINFVVSPQKMGENIILSCLLSPES